MESSKGKAAGRTPHYSIFVLGLKYGPGAKYSDFFKWRARLKAPSRPGAPRKMKGHYGHSGYRVFSDCNKDSSRRSSASISDLQLMQNEVTGRASSRFTLMGSPQESQTP